MIKEIHTKRSKPSFTSFFPSNEEMRYLLETGNFDLASERSKDRTTENAIKDALQRREHDIVNRTIVSKDVLELIFLETDIRTLLDASSKIPILANFLQDDKFWEKKFKIDFPFLPSKLPDPLLKQSTNMFKDLPWRRYYYVCRYYVMVFFTGVIRRIPTETAFKTFYCGFMTHQNGFVDITFYYNEYMENVVHKITRPIDEHFFQTFFKKSVIDVINQDFPYFEREPKFVESQEALLNIRAQYFDTKLEQQFKQGFVGYGKDMKILIGNSICNNCLGHATLKCSSCGVTACNRECHIECL